MNTSSFIAVSVIAGLAFAAGWVMHEKYSSDKDNDQPFEPNNDQEDQTHNPFVQ